MTVSVVVPCYNAEPYLAQTVNSVLEQTRPPDEVIVVNDGSTDGSLAIAESFGGRVRVLSERSGSASRTRIYGASVATGDALMFLDADDVLGPAALAALVSALERHPGSVASCPWYRLEQRDGLWVRRPPSCKPRRPGQDALEAWIDGWYRPPCSVLWSRSAYERAGGWDPAPSPNDDGDLMMRALVRGVPLHLTDRGSAFYRRLPEGAASLSGERLTRDGLEAWVGGIARIGRMLEERGRLGPYRRALGDAFGRLAEDAAPYPDLAAVCAGHRRRFGDPQWKSAVRGLREGVRARVGAARRRAGRLAGGPSAGAAAPPRESLEEVRFGLETASP
jgi:glycosyltransferase involved in cell wall biosynthesis